MESDLYRCASFIACDIKITFSLHHVTFALVAEKTLCWVCPCERLLCWRICARKTPTATKVEALVEKFIPDAGPINQVYSQWF